MAQPISYTTVRGTVIKETEKAVYFQVCEISGSPIEVASEWFPLSRIEKRLTDPKHEQSDTMVIESWLIDKFCEKRGI